MFTGVKCFCNVEGQRMCSGKPNRDDKLAVLESLLDFQTKRYKRFKRRKKSNDRKHLLLEAAAKKGNDVGRE